VLMVAMIQKYALERQTVFSAFDQASLAPAKAAGIRTMRIATSIASLPVSDLTSTNTDYLAYDYTNGGNTPARLQAMYDAGIKLTPFTFDGYRTEFTDEQTRVGRPLAGAYADDVWQAGGYPARANDPFITKQPWIGSLPGGHGSKFVWRDPDKFGFDFAGSANIMLGFLARQTPFTTLTFELTFEALLADTTRYAGINFAMTEDRNLGLSGVWPSTSTGGTMRFLIKMDGSMILQKTNPGSAATQLGATQASAVAVAGTAIPLKIEFPGTGTGGNDIKEITMTRKGRVYLKGKGGSTRTVAQTNLVKSYKKVVPKVERPEPRPLSVGESFHRAPAPVGPLHEPVQRDRFTPVALILGALIIAAIIVLWAIT
jgi:hypothetical protein